MRDEAWFEILERELADPVLYDEGVEAARNACVGGASIAAGLITAAAWYDNPITGAPALLDCMRQLQNTSFEPSAWVNALAPRDREERECAAGFGFVSTNQTTHIVEACRRLVEGTSREARRYRAFFLEHEPMLRRNIGPLNATGLSALTFLDHGVALLRAERLFIVCRVATAIREAQHAKQLGVGNFPFLSEGYVYEGTVPPYVPLDRASLKAQLGLE